MEPQSVFLPPTRTFAFGVGMVRDDFERCIAAGHFATDRTVGWANDFRSQAFLFLEFVVVQLELHPHAFFRRNDDPSTVLFDAAVPVVTVKEDVFAIIFGIDEAEIDIRLQPYDLSETAPLDAKLLNGRIAGIWRGHVQQTFAGKLSVG